MKKKTKTMAVSKNIRRFRKMTDDNVKAALSSINDGNLSFLSSILPLWKPDSGDSTIRILPLVESELLNSDECIAKKIVRFRINGSEHISPKSFNQNAECPMMNSYLKIKGKFGDNQEVMSDCRPRTSYLMIILPLSASNKKEARQPHLFLCPMTLYKEIMKRTRNRKTGEIRSFEHPTKGLPINFDKTGQGLNTEYGNVEVESEPYPIKQSVLDAIPEIDEILVIPSDEDLIPLGKALLLQAKTSANEDDDVDEVEEDDVDEDDSDEVDDDDSDDSDEVGDDEEEEEEEEEDDDGYDEVDDDEEEEEEEEEEAPRKKKKKKPVDEDEDDDDEVSW